MRETPSVPGDMTLRPRDIEHLHRQYWQMFQCQAIKCHAAALHLSSCLRLYNFQRQALNRCFWKDKRMYPREERLIPPRDLGRFASHACSSHYVRISTDANNFVVS